MRRKSYTPVMALVVLALAGSIQAVAAEVSPPKAKPLTPEEQQQLLQEVKDLRQRVQQLETQRAEQPAKKEEPAQLQDKVRGLEQDVAVLKHRDEIDKEAAAEKAKTTPTVTADKTGFAITSADKAFQLRVLGWISYDIGWFRQHNDLKLSIGDEQDGTGFRSIRLRFTGTMFENTDYQVELEFSGQNGQDTPEIYDTYFRLRDIPYFCALKGNLTLGHFREPFGLEELTNEPSRMMQEKSLNSAFYPSRNAGVQWSDSLLGEPGQERLYYAVGVFKDTDNWPSGNDSDENQGWQVTGRLTGLPYYKYNGEQLIHVGLSYSHRNPNGAVVGWMAPGESRLQLFKYVDSEKFKGYRLSDARAESIDMVNFELAGVYGAFNVQGEYAMADVNTTFDHTRRFSGFYAQASYTLTGETRPYRNDNATFDLLTPKKNFSWGKDGGWGAWEVAGRYSSVDLSSGGVRGGEQSEAEAQLRWYLNRSANLSLAWVRNFVENGAMYSGDFDSLQLRATIYF